MKIKALAPAALFITGLAALALFYLLPLFEPEVVIPEVKVSNGGLGRERSSEPVTYFHPEDREFITISPKLRASQKAGRYLKVKGRVKLERLPFKGEQFRTAIFELRHESYSGGRDQARRYFLTLPLDKWGYYSGYLYFKESGHYQVSLYLFYDYLAHFGVARREGKRVDTLASLGFEVEVEEGVPEELHYLLPSENVDCGNRKLRRLSRRIVREAGTELERARAIYEYLVFYRQGQKGRVAATYKSDRKLSSPATYNSTYIASQVLGSEEVLCNDFAELYAAMMRSLGYRVKRVSAFSDSERSVGHIWNLVDLKGDGREWLKVDAIWGHQDRKNYKKWAQLYPEFDEEYFQEAFRPYNHRAFRFYRRVEY